MSILRLFDDKSEIYAESRPQYPSELFLYLNSLCESHSTAWDAACGNGQASIDLAKYFTDIYATDISEQQISHAKQSPNIHYSVQPSENTSFPDKYFDLVCVAQALHWFDFDSFWSEVKRVLKPNGIFAAWGYSWFSINPEIDGLIKQSFRDIIEPHWARQNKLLWDHYKDIAMPFSKISTPNIAMAIEWNLDQLFMYLHSWSATRRCMSEQGEHFFLDSYEKVKTIWGDKEEKKIVTMDFCLLAGRNS